MPVRIGTPIRFANLGGLVDEYRTPSYATAIGLVLEGDNRENEEIAEREPVHPAQAVRNAPNIFKRISSWIKNGLF
jgi:cell division protein FtsA